MTELPNSGVLRTGQTADRYVEVGVPTLAADETCLRLDGEIAAAGGGTTQVRFEIGREDLDQLIRQLANEEDLASGLSVQQVLRLAAVVLESARQKAANLAEAAQEVLDLRVAEDPTRDRDSLGYTPEGRLRLAIETVATEVLEPPDVSAEG
ncbi:hypothetical protein [Pseudactinotalea terrae]|uniref:hypothetical protein n=1 Tax=Pseudactinotalea terrae TaxID=1743262 RepID=UPI0012E1AF95|nr:hypothetical protein [Pseudactinotalea terrae]